MVVRSKEPVLRRDTGLGLPSVLSVRLTHLQGAGLPHCMRLATSDASCAQSPCDTQPACGVLSESLDGWMVMDVETHAAGVANRQACINRAQAFVYMT